MILCGPTKWYRACYKLGATNYNNRVMERNTVHYGPLGCITAVRVDMQIYETRTYSHNIRILISSDALQTTANLNGIS